jgi:hypothetical protein
MCQGCKNVYWSKGGKGAAPPLKASGAACVLMAAAQGQCARPVGDDHQESAGDREIL